MDTLVLALIGLALLSGFAWIIGRVEANARNGAWRRIADARRHLHDQEAGLLSCLSGTRCPDCPVQRYVDNRFGD